jgi:FkbM family methyltransferase
MHISPEPLTVRDATEPWLRPGSRTSALKASKRISFVVRELSRWPRRILRAVFQPSRHRFVVLSPWFSRQQWVFDRRVRKIWRFAIRDRVDFGVLEQVFVDEDYRLERLSRWADIRTEYERILATGATPWIIDCGANIGLSAAYFARCFPAARILGIEPEAGNVALARRNCAANGFSQVTFLQAAVASAPHKGGAVVDPGLGAWGFRVDPGAPGDLEFVSVDGLIEAPANAGLVPFIIKIDIEGFERDLFAANTGWIDRFHLLVVELHDWMLPSQASSRAFLQAVSRFDRDFLFRGENVFSIANRFPR